MKGDVFNKAQLDQTKSPGNTEGAQPPGGVVSLFCSVATVWSVSALSLSCLISLPLVSENTNPWERLEQRQ